MAPQCPMSRPWALPLPFLPLLSLALFSGCGPSRTEEARGVIAEIGGEVRVVSPEQEKEVCSTHACEPNYVYRASAVAAKPGREKVDYSRALLGLPEAWKTTRGSREVVVAVVDTGVDLSHPDLKANLWANEAELNGRPGVDDDGNGYIDDVYGYDFRNGRPRPADDNEHGTHCAGIIGAEAGNGLGTAGVSPRVRIMALKFLGGDGSGDTASAIRAIDYAVAMGARVISNSWGGPGRSELLAKAIARAVAKGVLVVAAAGNESTDNDRLPSFPASYPGVISVASTDSRDRLSDFSNFGSNGVTLAAPGTKILSTVPGGGLKTLSGTSMAAPQVSGALALALAIDPRAEASALQQALCETSRKILLDRVSCGRLDVAAFVGAIARTAKN